MYKRFRLQVTAISAATFLFAASATAGIHTWDVVEIFSNFDGTVQYVELLDKGTGGTEIGVGNGSLTSGLHSFAWANGTVTPPTNGKRYLIATAGYAALALAQAAPAPDVIIPPENVPFFTIAGDTISFAGVDSQLFLSAPINGTDSRDEAGVVAVNSPQNYAGATGSIVASGPIQAPSLSAIMLSLLVLSLSVIAVVHIGMQRRNAAA